jgi:hypothetical protein
MVGQQIISSVSMKMKKLADQNSLREARPENFT